MRSLYLASQKRYLVEPVNTHTARLKATLLVTLGIGLLPISARAAGSEAIEKPVRTLISAVRYGRDALALTFLSGDQQSRLLLGADWNKGTAAQRSEFLALFHKLFAAMAFPRIRADFEHLETILYEAPKIDGDKAELGSTLVILHPMKKQEIKVRYALSREKSWKVVDVTVLGDKSMLTNIRNDQVAPILKEGGFPHLLDLMRKRAAELAQSAK